MRKINFLLVATLLVALAIPAQQANAGTIIGLQGGYIRHNPHSATVTTSGGVSTTTTRADWLIKNATDMQGGYGELNYDMTFGLGKILYVGVGGYFQYAGVKNVVWTNAYDQKLTHRVAVGPEIIVGLGIISLLDITIRAGVGYAASFGPRYTVGLISTTRKIAMGVNWRVLPGITVKFGKIGVFVEGGYVGNWLQHTNTTTSVKTAVISHGAQVGAGVKFYL